MKTFRILLATALAAGTVLLPAAGASAATPDPGPAFGHHASECAKTMGGSSGGHNPGMHQGKTGSAGMTSTMPMTMPMPMPMQTMSMH